MLERRDISDGVTHPFHPEEPQLREHCTCDWPRGLVWMTLILLVTVCVRQCKALPRPLDSGAQIELLQRCFMHSFILLNIAIRDGFAVFYSEIMISTVSSSRSWIGWISDCVSVIGDKLPAAQEPRALFRCWPVTYLPG